MLCSPILRKFNNYRLKRFLGYKLRPFSKVIPFSASPGIACSLDGHSIFRHTRPHLVAPYITLTKYDAETLKRLTRKTFQKVLGLTLSN